MSFEDAQQVCSSEGSHLAFIDNDKTREFVGKQFASRRDPKNAQMFWIGGNLLLLFLLGAKVPQHPEMGKKKKKAMMFLSLIHKFIS